MKIGILTLPLHTNYGGILQAYALQTVLERMGHKVVVLDKKPYRYLPVQEMPLSYIKRIIKKYILGKNIIILAEQYYNKNYPIISQYTQPFIERYIHRVDVANLLTLNEKDFDALIVGSDQIWRPCYYQHIENAFLSFAENWQVKRLAYAASFGSEKWEYTSSQTKRCAKLVKKFDVVTVREETGVKLCQEYLGIDAKWVLDPTMLLTKEDYENIIDSANIEQNTGDMLIYVLDTNKQRECLINEIVKHVKLKPFYVSSKVEDIFAPIEQRIQRPVEVWLRGFRDSKLVVTDSFHACVFSILFNKPFIVLKNEERGITRLSSLLNLFGLENRLVTSIDEITQLSEIDWNFVNLTHVKLKEKCLDILRGL